MDPLCNRHLHEDYVELLPSSLLIPHYLIHCYLYYEEAAQVINDHQFDELAQRLVEEWDSLNHRHKELLDHGALKSGGSYLSGTYPRIVKETALQLC